jgi:hypothetical protein
MLNPCPKNCPIYGHVNNWRKEYQYIRANPLTCYNIEDCPYQLERVVSDSYAQRIYLKFRFKILEELITHIFLVNILYMLGFLAVTHALKSLNIISFSTQEPLFSKYPSEIAIAFAIPNAITILVNIVRLFKHQIPDPDV